MTTIHFASATPHAKCNNNNDNNNVNYNSHANVYGTLNIASRCTSYPDDKQTYIETDIPAVLSLGEWVTLSMRSTPLSGGIEFMLPSDGLPPPRQPTAEGAISWATCLELRHAVDGLEWTQDSQHSQSFDGVKILAGSAVSVHQHQQHSSSSSLLLIIIILIIIVIITVSWRR